MKKFIAVILMVVLMAGCFTGCGIKTSDKDSDIITISIGAWPKDTKPVRYEQYEKMREEFMKKYPNINIERDNWVYSVDTYLPKAAGGQLPTYFGAYFTETSVLASSGYVKDITEAMEKYGYMDNLKDEIVDVIKYEDRVYAIPNDAYVMGLFINADLFKKAGFVDENGTLIYPETLEELAETAKVIKEKTGKAGITFPTINNAGGWQFLNIAWAYGTEFMKQIDGKWVATFDSPECVQALQYIKDLKWKYNCLSDNITVDNGELHKMYSAGETAMMFAAPSDSVLNSLAANFGVDNDSIYVSTIPAGPKGKFAQLGGNVNFINADATEEQVDAVFKWIEFTGNFYKLSENGKESIDRSFKTKVEEGGIIGMPEYSIWKSGEVVDYTNELRAKYKNVDDSHFIKFAEFEDVTIKPEEPVNCQELYAALDNVIQAVLTDKNADPAKLLKTAASEFQQNYLDYANQ